MDCRFIQGILSIVVVENERHGNMYVLVCYGKSLTANDYQSFLILLFPLTSAESWKFSSLFSLTRPGCWLTFMYSIHLLLSSSEVNGLE